MVAGGNADGLGTFFVEVAFRTAFVSIA